jgi:hypothetical protein
MSPAAKLETPMRKNALTNGEASAKNPKAAPGFLT